MDKAGMTACEIMTRPIRSRLSAGVVTHPGIQLSRFHMARHDDGTHCAYSSMHSGGVWGREAGRGGHIAFPHEAR